ncbi:hypothetical protein K1719_010580 [Acacia pycnantha]|nr:hypothetical protein K1719_010580 [Acacia pycnantha]
MATSSRTKTKSCGPVLRSVSPSSRFCSYSTSNTRFSSPSSAFAFSTSSSFSSPSSSFFNETNRHQHHIYIQSCHHEEESPHLGPEENLYVLADQPSRSAMKNSVVRIGGVEGEWVKRALTALIRPSSHQQRRRASFEPRPSRLSVMSKAEGL